MRRVWALALMMVPGAAWAETISVWYDCARGAVTQAIYLNHADQSQAIVMVEGRMVAFEVAIFGSGARYVAVPGTPQPYVWWTKGETATLFPDDKGDAILSDCVARAR